MIKEIKDLLLESSYRYVTDIERRIPLDKNGNAIPEYLSYVALDSMHDLLQTINRDVAHIIIEEPKEDENYTNAYIESSFYVIPDDIMDTIMRLISRMEKKEKEKAIDKITGEDFNLSV